MSRTKKWTLISAIAGAAVVIGIAGVWLFGSPAVVSAAEGVASTVLGHRGGPGGWFRGGAVDHDQLLADELGVTVDELDAARDAANEAALAQAVEEGRITQEEADAMLAQRELHEALMAYIDRDALMAEALGMTVEELQAALDAGTSLPDLLAEQGLDAATFHENMTAANEAALAQAVEDGVITQEQADEMLSRPQNGRGRGGMMPGGEGGRGRGGMMEGGDADGMRFQNRTPAVDGSDA